MLRAVFGRPWLRAAVVAGVGIGAAASGWSLASGDGHGNVVRLLTAHSRAFGGRDALVVRMISGLVASPPQRALFVEHGGVEFVLRRLDGGGAEVVEEVADLLAVLSEDVDVRGAVWSKVSAKQWVALVASGHPRLLAVLRAAAVEASVQPGLAHPLALTTLAGAVPVANAALALGNQDAVAFALWVLGWAITMAGEGALNAGLAFLDVDALAGVLVAAVDAVVGSSGDPPAVHLPAVKLLASLVDARSRCNNAHTAFWEHCRDLYGSAKVVDSLLQLAAVGVPRRPHHHGLGAERLPQTAFTASSFALDALTAVAAMPEGRRLLTDATRFPQVVALLRRCNSWPRMGDQLPPTTVVFLARLAAALSAPATTGVAHMVTDCAVVDGTDDVAQAKAEESNAESWARYWPDAATGNMSFSSKQDVPMVTPSTVWTEFAFGVLNTGNPDCRPAALSTLENLVLHTHNAGVVLQDWLLHIINAAAAGEGDDVNGVVSSVVTQGMDNVASRAVRSVLRRDVYVPTAGPRLEVPQFQANCMAALANLAKRPSTHAALRANGAYRAILLLSERVEGPAPSPCGDAAEMDAADVVTQCARCVANLATVVSPEANLDSLLSARAGGGRPDLLHRLQGRVEAWSKSCNLTLRTQAHRALLNIAALHAGATGADPVYEDMLWPLFDEEWYGVAPGATPIDIVMVHGLDGGPLRTFRVGGGGAPATVCKPSSPGLEDDVNALALVMGAFHAVWPLTWLVQDLRAAGYAPRLVSVEYNGNLLVSSSAHPARTLDELAPVVARQLRRAGVGSRAPVVFLTHSMGGLLTKEVLTAGAPAVGFPDLAANTAGVLFNGTPHFGSPIALESQRIMDMFASTLSAPLIKELGPGNARLTALDAAFSAVADARGIAVLSLGETLKTSIGFKLSTMVVPPTSSQPGFGDFVLVPDSTHFDINKPKSREDVRYRLVKEFVEGTVATPKQ